MRRLSYLFLFALFSISLLPVAAKGRAIRIDITGPGIENPWVLTEPEVLEGLSIGRLEDLASGPIAAPFDDTAQPAYEMKRYMGIVGETSIPWDIVRYYADPNGARGYIYYVGLVNGFSEYDNRWFRVTESGETSVRDLLANQPESGLQRFIKQLQAWMGRVGQQAALPALAASDFSLQP
jgi:hypothetical protein